MLHFWRSSRPHVAVLGQVLGTAHFRNVLRHAVVCTPEVLSLRIDESHYFGNARTIEHVVQEAVASRPAVRHVVLNCAAVNGIDASAHESLELIMHRLSDAGIRLHLSEVKGPVMDRLKGTQLLDDLTGQVFLSHYQAIDQLARREGEAGGSGEADRSRPDAGSGRSGARRKETNGQRLRSTSTKFDVSAWEPTMHSQPATYTMDRMITEGSFDEVVARTREALAAKGFGVLTEIDVRDTLKKKIGEEIADYVILGACNPRMANEALKIEPRVGAMLPCNVIVRATGDGAEVSAIDPVASMMAIDNAALQQLASKVRDMLREAVASI